MNIPGRISHNNIKLPQYLKIEVSQIAVDPLRIFHPHLRQHLLLRSLRLLILLDIMYQFTVRIVAGIEMRTVTKTLVCILVDDGSEMFLLAERVTSCFLAFVSRAVVAVLEILPLFEL